MMMSLAKASGSGSNVIVDDRLERRQNFNLVQSPPRNFLTSIYWTRQTVTGVNLITTSVSVLTENNYSFVLSSLDDYAALIGIFDQFCIYGVTITMTYGSANTGTSVQSITVCTAIDYDNVANLGSLVLLTDFGTFNQTVLTPGVSLVRMVKPCVATAAYTGSFGGFTTARMWLDSASPSVNHYGFRTMIPATGAVATVNATFEYIVGFRNSH